MRVMKELLELEDDDILIKSIRDSVIENIPELLKMKYKYIDDLHLPMNNGEKRKFHW